MFKVQQGILGRAREGEGERVWSRRRRRARVGSPPTTRTLSCFLGQAPVRPWATRATRPPHPRRPQPPGHHHHLLLLSTRVRRPLLRPTRSSASASAPSTTSSPTTTRPTTCAAPPSAQSPCARSPSSASGARPTAASASRPSSTACSPTSTSSTKAGSTRTRVRRPPLSLSLRPSRSPPNPS